MKLNQLPNNHLATKLLNIAMFSCFCSIPLFAQEEGAAEPEAKIEGESREQIIKRLVDLGPGVHEVKKTPSGKLKSVKVVGQARISKVLGNAKGLQVAQQKAKMSAEQAYIEWLNTNAASVKVDAEETVITLSGDGEKQTEEGKTSEKITNEVKSNAAGLIRGLSLVGKDVNSDGEQLTSIFVWSPVRAAQAGESAKANNNGTDSGAATETGSPSKKNAIESKTTISPDFDE